MAIGLIHFQTKYSNGKAQEHSQGLPPADAYPTWTQCAFTEMQT